ncbi:MAG: heme-binding domain-containing protein [Myxococcota bacterium]
MRWRRVLIGAGALGVAIQWIPVDRDNPPVTLEISAPQPVLQVLRRSCYDCHSNLTRWPWYSRVAPVSWLVAYDVHEARRHMNFSTWDRYDDEDRRHARKEIRGVLKDGEMPLPYYLPLHPEARLSEADVALVQDWARSGDSGPEPR